MVGRTKGEWCHNTPESSLEVIHCLKFFFEEIFLFQWLLHSFWDVAASQNLMAGIPTKGWLEFLNPKKMLQFEYQTWRNWSQMCGSSNFKFLRRRRFLEKTPKKRRRFWDPKSRWGRVFQADAVEERCGIAVALQFAWPTYFSDKKTFFRWLTRGWMVIGMDLSPILGWLDGHKNTNFDSFWVIKLMGF